MQIHPLSEFSLINRIAKKFPKYNHDVVKGIGDDTAVIKINKNKCLLFTCDAQVSGEHFLEKYSSPYQIGRKAAAVNLSDIAAMGGVPKHILVSLFLPKRTTEKCIDELYRGLTDECKKYNVEIIGGNIAKSNQFIIDIFLIGEVIPKNLLLRSGAQVGDAVMVTGTLGDSAISKHLTPIPRVREGILFAKSGMVTSMIDISDGLSSDIQHICDESKVGVKLFLEKLPVSNGVEKLIALNGGEDYELCFTTSFKNISYLSQLLKKKIGVEITVIGEITASKEGRWLIDENGKKIKLVARGWNHLL